MVYLIDLTSLDDNFSGIERYACCITKELLQIDSINHYIIVFKNEVFKEFETFEKQKNVEFKILYGKNRLIFNQIILLIFLLKTNVDKYLFLSFPCPVLFCKKGIYNAIHDMGAWDHPEAMKVLSRLYFKISYRCAGRISEKLITVSDFSKRRIHSILKTNKKKIAVIPSGLADTFSNSDVLSKRRAEHIRAKYSLPSNYIICLSTLEPRKNINLLIEAFLMIQSEVDYKLVLAGRKGWKVDDLYPTSDNYLDNIYFTGFIEEDDIAYVYKMAKCFVFPSLYEGFGLPPLEALKLEVPVIASDIPAHLEVLGEQAMYFKNNNREDLIDKLKRINMDDLSANNGLTDYQVMRFNYHNSAKLLLDSLKKS